MHIVCSRTCCHNRATTMTVHRLKSLHQTQHKTPHRRDIALAAYRLPNWSVNPVTLECRCALGTECGTVLYSSGMALRWRRHQHRWRRRRLRRRSRRQRRWLFWLSFNTSRRPCVHMQRRNVIYWWSKRPRSNSSYSSVP